MTHVIPRLIKIAERIDHDGYSAQADELVRIAENLLGGFGGGDLDDQPTQSLPSAPESGDQSENMDTSDDEDGEYTTDANDLEALINETVRGYVFDAIQAVKPEAILRTPQMVEQAITDLYRRNDNDDPPQGVANALSPLASTYYGKTGQQLDLLMDRAESKTIDQAGLRQAIEVLAGNLSTQYADAIGQQLAQLFPVKQ